MRGWSAGRRIWTIAVYVAVVSAAAAWMAWWLGHIFDQPDASFYLDMAEGRPAILPFASRQLGPLLVRGLVHVLPLSIHEAFVLEGVAAMLFFVGATAFLLARSGAPQWTIPALGGMFFWVLQFHALVMPDLLYAALLSGFLLLLQRQHLLAAALMMFPLTLSRESTLLTVVCFLWAGWGRLRRNEIAAALLAMLGGMLVVKQLAAGALPNQEHISPLFYMAAKMPWNFLKNVLGIGVWANLYPSCEVPRWQMAVHLGPLRAIGSCGFFPEPPTETFAYGLACFGLLPLLVIRLWPARAISGAREALLVRFATIYGAISFLLAPLLGESLTRLYGYGWPLFLVGLPLLLGLSGAHFRSRWSMGLFLAVHIGLSWSILWLNSRLVLMVGVACWVACWLMLKKSFQTGAAGEETEILVGQVCG